MLNDLPAELQSRIEALYTHLELAIPESLGSGVDGFVPLLEYIMGLGGVFLIKWDGERQSRCYTAVVLHPKMESYSVDDHTVEVATAKAVLAFADAVLGSSDTKP